MKTLSITDVAERVVELYPSTRFPYRSVINLGSGFSESERAFFSAPFDRTVEPRLYLLRDILYDLETGALFHDGQLLAEFASNPDLMARIGRSGPKPLLRLDADNWVVVGCNSQSSLYYHWLLQDLPALVHGAAAAPGSPLLLCPVLSAVQSTCLELLDLMALPRVEAKLNYQYYIPRAVFSDFHLGATLFQVSIAARQTFAELRRRAPRSLTPTKFYVSRAGARYRNVLNESALHPILRSFGYDIVCLERLPLLTQINLFGNARCIVAPHGGGLANLVFATRHALLFEQLGEGWINPCFNVLAKASRMTYWGDVFQADSQAASVMLANMIIDPEAFRETLMWIEAYEKNSAEMDKLDDL